MVSKKLDLNVTNISCVIYGVTWANYSRCNLKNEMKKQVPIYFEPETTVLGYNLVNGYPKLNLMYLNLL